MFEEVIRELRRLNGRHRTFVDMPLDEKGYLDRQCPAAQCKASFKVVDQDWNEKLANETAYCPICGKSAEDTEWNTPDQIAYATREIERAATGRINRALRTSARRFNSRHQRGFIQLRMSVRPDRLPVRVPIGAAEALRQDFACAECGCRYSTIGAAFFCPACRHNCPLTDFETCVRTITTILDGIASISSTIRDTSGLDAARNVERQLLENAVEDIATVLQRTSGALFCQLPNQANYRRDANLFQRLVDASDLWKQATGASYEDFVTSYEWALAKRMMQRRHKIGHEYGMVDQRYVDQSGDRSYEPGQRLVVHEREVRDLLAIVIKLLVALRGLVP